MSLTYRFELKYLMTVEDARALENDIKRFGMKLDPHTDPELGHYLITSLYFDSLTHEHYDDKSGGFIKRKKIRLRVYGPTLFPSPKFWLEIKHKYELKDAKTRVILTEDEARSLIVHGPTVLYKVKCERAERDTLLRAFYEISAKPMIYVRYKRKAYVDNKADLRVTFDYDIEGASFTDERIDRLKAALHPGQILLEVKFFSYLPPWFVYIISAYNLDRESHSKFNLCSDEVNRLNPFAN